MVTSQSSRHVTTNCKLYNWDSTLTIVTDFNILKKNAKWLYVPTEGRINNQLEKYELSYSLSYGTILLNLQLRHSGLEVKM